MKLATLINLAIAAHGCHMQQDEVLIDHIVEHADEIRGSAVTAFNEAIAKLNEEHQKEIASLKERIQALINELAVKSAAHADADQITKTTEEEREALRRAHTRTVDDSDAGREHLTDEGETEELTGPNGEYRPQAAAPITDSAPVKKVVAKPKSKRK